MRAVVRRIHSPDIDLVTGQVEDPEDFGILLQVMVGPVDGPGEESFDVMVCTPAWLARRVREQGPVIGRHYLIVDAYDRDKIEGFLRRRIESLEAEDWGELARKIGRIGMWEFEDYSE